jgi:catechol 2,3-dioxygenase-like lactoylglutathione lyase family enzyme
MPERDAGRRLVEATTGTSVRIRHAGVVVSDMEEAIAFYRDLLGLEVVLDTLEEGEYFERLVARPGAKSRVVKLRDNHGALLELLQYFPPEGSPQQHGAGSATGFSHVAFTVDDLTAVYSRLGSLGYTFNSEPLMSPDGRTKVVYCHGPDGTFVELVEVLQ